MELANVVINDELCPESHSEDTPLGQEKIMEVEDTLPKEYVGKHSDEDLQLLNDTILEQSTPIRETQQEQSELSSSSRQKSTSTSLVKGPSARVKLNHPATNIFGSLNDNMRLRSKALNVITHLCYLSQFKPKKVDEALQDADWINSMHEELHQFVRNDVWELVPRPDGVNVIGTNWFFRNKLDEHGTVIRNKLRLLLKDTHKWKGLTLMRLLHQ